MKKDLVSKDILKHDTQPKQMRLICGDLKIDHS